MTDETEGPKGDDSEVVLAFGVMASTAGDSSSIQECLFCDRPFALNEAKATVTSPGFDDSMIAICYDCSKAIAMTHLRLDEVHECNQTPEPPVPDIPDQLGDELDGGADG